jgi:AcrR family transcriptional regulator
MAAPVRQRRARGSITPEAVIKGAFELAETETLDGLSMPRLARYLDVGVTSIYWYFKSKDELLDALTEEAFRRFYGQMPPLAGRRWDDVLREFFRSFRRILRADDVLCDLCIMRTMTHTAETVALTAAKVDEVTGILAAQDFSAESAYEAYAALSVYTRGCLFIERLIRVHGLSDRQTRARTPGTVSIVARHGETHEISMVEDEDFEFGLENAIRGLRALRTAEKRKR